MKHKISTLLAALACLGANAALAGDLYVIAHPGLKVDTTEVRDIFLGDKLIAGGVKLTPLDNSAAQKEFLARVVNFDANKYGTIWAKKGFRDGLNPPPLKGGDAAVIAEVKSNPGAIGYITSKPDSGVTVVQKY